ncbi:hypothetical protein Syun_008940 [Stephania yunnanensis]|uniref:Pentatricopeptide repeat-containing protein n=1 Tax=Stephania yunnanensis TaxID=152371 RepID=A0AAP0KDI8_9MAGN
MSSHQAKRFKYHLNQCYQSKNLNLTKSLHAYILKTSHFLSTSLTLTTSLILSYSLSFDHHHHNTTISTTHFNILTNLFKSIDTSNPFPFNTIVSHLSHHGHPSLALHTLSFMHSNGVVLDSYAFCSSLTAAAAIRSVGFGKMMHAHIEKLGWLSSVYVGSALIDLYVKTSAMNDARSVFDEMPVRNVVCVNALFSGFVEGRMWEDGLNLVRRMRGLGMECDRFTMCGLLRVCAGLAKIELGRQVHGSLIRRVEDFGGDVFLRTSLIDMYGRCGVVEKARHVFDHARIGGGGEGKRDVVLWTSMLGVCGRNGHFEDVIELFKEMLMEGTKPDKIVFLAVISACSYTGNVSQGLQYFESMVGDFGLNPDQEHYSCVVDLLCRAGELERALDLISSMPFKTGTVDNSTRNGGTNNTSLWGALLNACVDSGNVELGKLAAERALEADPQNVGIYVLWSNLCASVGMWDEIEKLRDLIRERGLMKDVGCSWLEVVS